MSRRLIAYLEARLSRLARFSYVNPRRVLVLVACLSVVALFGARRLSVDTDLAHLLPKSFASVQDLDALIERAGTVGYVVVAVKGATSEQRQAYARELSPQISQLPSIKYVDTERPLDWFSDRALYFAAPAQLEEARARIARRARWEKRRHNPMYLDLEGGAAPPLEFDDLKNDTDTPRWLSGASRGRFYEDAERGTLVMLARPRGRATDMGFAKNVVGEVQEVIRSAPPPAGMTASLTGRFVKKLDQKAQITADLALTSMVALGLVLLYLAAHFRRLSAVVLLAAPLGAGVLWTFGAVGFIYGGLNILTAFVGAILLGLGIDHGIHLLSAYDHARTSGAAGAAAIARSFGKTGRAVIIAAVTTMAGFVGVALSEFRAFRELFWATLRNVAYASSGEFFRRAKIKIGATQLKGARHDVVVHAELSDEDLETDITFHWRTIAGKLRLVDVSFDGASLVLDYKNQFGRIVTKKGGAGLIQLLRDKYKESIATPLTDEKSVL